MVGSGEVDLSEEEAKLYDRQIRLWGFEAQKSLRNARVLVIGLGGLGAEIVKNIVLSGVKAVTLLDHRVSTESDTTCQFLIPVEDIGKNRAEASQKSAQLLNPLVSVTADSQNPAEKSDSFYCDFEVIVSCEQDIDLNLKLNKLCRTAGILFFASDVIGSFGWVFLDLQEHKFILDVKKLQNSNETRKISRSTYVYPSLEQTLGADFKGEVKAKELSTQPPLFFLFKILCTFYHDFGRYPSDSSEDSKALSALREQVLEGVNYPKDFFPDVIFQCVRDGQPNPICALVGAVVAQEVVKAITKRDTPIHNMFFFDPLTLCGQVQAVPSEITLARYVETKTDASN